MRFTLQRLLTLERMLLRLEGKTHDAHAWGRKEEEPDNTQETEPLKITIYRRDVIILRRIKQRLDELRQQALGG